MKVFITGATGVFGTRLVDELANRGHEPVGLVRDNDSAQLVEQHGGIPVKGDLFDVDSLADAAGNADAVVHAATSLPTKTKTEAEDWEQNDRVRVEGVDAGEVDVVVAPDGYLAVVRPGWPVGIRDQFANGLDQVVGERVVVVDDQHPHHRRVGAWSANSCWSGVSSVTVRPPDRSAQPRR
jgi:NAD(P)-dependent dehydrogenase (short-subunit alcohol dehydrogenase family)